MSISSDIHEKAGPVTDTRERPPAAFSSDVIPYLLSTTDAFIILVSSVIGGISYQLAMGNSVPNILPHCAVGLLASFIHILRISGTGYYDFPDCAKPRVETGTILVCWFTTGLLLAFFAFLLKVGVAWCLRGILFRYACRAARSAQTDQDCSGVGGFARNDWSPRYGHDR